MSPPEARTEKWSREASVVLRACERSNVGDVYSPWGEVTSVTEGKEAMRPEARAKKWSRESSAVLRACERPNVGDVYSPRGDVTLVTEWNETGRPEARAKKVVEGSSVCSEIVRATKRRRRIFSLWRCHVSDRGERSREARSSR